MEILKRFSVYFVLCLAGFTTFAGTTVPVDAASGEVVFKRTFKVHSNFTDEDAFVLVQNWFNGDATKFTCQNTEGPNGTCKNKSLIEDAFKNPMPLQSLDPASGRMSGRGVIKYFGGASSSVGALYLEYYLLIEVSRHQVTATISKINYHHYNQRTYVAKPIFAWQGGKPLDSADKLGNMLISEQSETKDIMDVSTFVNQNIEKLFGDLELFLQDKQVLSENN